MVVSPDRQFALMQIKFEQSDYNIDKGDLN